MTSVAASPRPVPVSRCATFSKTDETTTLPAGDVIVVNPLLGAPATGKVEKAKPDDYADFRVPLATFTYNSLSTRDAGVFILPATAKVKILKLTGKDKTSLRSAARKATGIDKKNANQRELGAIDVDGDGKADLGVAFGCNGFADGECQNEGEIVLVHSGSAWTVPTL